jgi:hypothetical protein
MAEIGLNLVEEDANQLWSSRWRVVEEWISTTIEIHVHLCNCQYNRNIKQSFETSAKS